MKSPEADHWWEAMHAEIKVMKERRVWRLVELPKNKSVVGCRWVYTIKRDEKGKIARYKARLVAQGFKQIRGETYDETFSPVVNFGVIRLFFSMLVSSMSWTHIQCDVKSAYLYAPLKEEIYMCQPPGFINEEKSNLVCKLDKALYGLCQSGRVWFYEIDKVLIKLGFKKLTQCNCVYSFHKNLILLLYVDDIVLFGRTNEVVQNALKLLEKHFDIKVMGRTKNLLGVELEEKEGLFMHQKSYINEIYERFKSFNPPVSSLPIAKGTVYSMSQCPKTEYELEEMDRIPYRNLLGCLSFLCNRTRPDISYTVNILSQFQSKPGVAHWNGLLRLLGYVYKSQDLMLNLKSSKPNLVAYSDADFASNRDDRTSLGGQLVLFDRAPISWRTFKHRCVSLSTMESELISMTESAKELLWYDRIISECFRKGILTGPKAESILFVDNMATIDFVKSPIENNRSKHIDVRLFFVRDLIYKDVFKVNYIPSKRNLADNFTKAQTRCELNNFIDILFS